MSSVKSFFITNFSKNDKSSWEALNRECRTRMLLSDLSEKVGETFFSRQPTKIFETVIEFLGRDYFRGGNNIYCIAPEIVDPTIPLKESLELEEDPFKNKKRLRMKKEPQMGFSGRIKFVRFRGDPNAERWFAIKRRGLSWTKIDDVVRDYERNCQVAAKIGNHPNFMQVCGMVIKEKKKEPKPYLILDYVEGDILRDALKSIKKLSLDDTLFILSQLRDIFLHLFDCRIFPKDLNTLNILISKEKRLKCIDFDFWREETSISPEELASQLLGFANEIARELPYWKGFCLPLGNLSPRESLEYSLNRPNCRTSSHLQLLPFDPDQSTFIRLVSNVFEEVARPSIKSIILITKIEAGSGDYFSALNGAKVIKKIMPDADLRVVAIATEEKIRSLPPVDLSEYCVSKVEFFSEFSMESCKADLVTALPKDPMWNKEWPIDLAHFSVEEYSKHSHYPDEHEVMGVSDASVGIFVPEIEIAPSFKDKRLEELFTDKEKPFFCYMHNPYYFWQFAIDFTKYSKGPLRIISPFPSEKRYKKWYQDPSSNSFRKIDLSKFSKIERIDFLTDGKIKREVLYEGKEGKVMQIINPFPLDHSDFLRCASLSQSVVGCTGDISFSETFYLDDQHIPYYEVLDHKKHFWFGMCDLARKYKKEKAYRFLDTLRPQHDSTYPRMNPELVSDPDLIKEMNDLKEIIRSQYNIENFLIPLINRAILYAKYPKLKQIADGLFQQFKAKTIELSELQENLSKAIKDCALY